MLATDYAEYYGIAPQGKDESDVAFRGRVAGVLRGNGQLVEAHEAFNDERIDYGGGNVMTGVIGAIAQVVQGVDYGHKNDGYRQVGDDIAAGTIVQSPKKEIDPMMAMLAIMMSDRR